MGQWNGYTELHWFVGHYTHTHTIRTFKAGVMGEWEEHLNLLQEQIDPRAWPSSSSGNPDPSPPHTTYPGQAATNHWPSALQTQDLNYSHTHTETCTHT